MGRAGRKSVVSTMVSAKEERPRGTPKVEAPKKDEGVRGKAEPEKSSTSNVEEDDEMDDDGSTSDEEDEDDSSAEDEGDNSDEEDVGDASDEEDEDDTSDEEDEGGTSDEEDEGEEDASEDDAKPLEVKKRVMDVAEDSTPSKKAKLAAQGKPSKREAAEYWQTLIHAGRESEKSKTKVKPPGTSSSGAKQEALTVSKKDPEKKNAAAKTEVKSPSSSALKAKQVSSGPAKKTPALGAKQVASAPVQKIPALETKQAKQEGSAPARKAPAAGAKQELSTPVKKNVAAPQPHSVKGAKSNTSDSGKKIDQHVCKACNRSFQSDSALAQHNNAKHRK